MANETLTLIQSAQVNASTTAITFSSIPQTFTDLIIKMSVRGTQASINQSYTLRFNGSTSTFTGIRMYGSGGGTPASDATAQPEAVGASATANTFSNHEVTIPNYTSANYKSYSIEGAAETNATTTYIVLAAGLWSTASAITSFSINTTDLFVQHTTMSLYGVAKFGVTPTGTAKASGGDVVTNDGTYWYHAFKTSGVFTPFVTLSCDYLVVAGGGGGGGGSYGDGGGGGAGGYLTSTGYSCVSGTGLTVTVGAGGNGGAYSGNVSPISGSNSVFATITSTGGGYGARSLVPTAGASGGSGGGAGYNGTFGTGISGQGNNGGGRALYYGGGGGGAGGAGGNGSVGYGGAGGAGLNTLSTWLNTTGTGVSGYIAGGGGGSAETGTGGAAGSGGGGAGSAGSGGLGISGTVNTGGGGGSGYNSGNQTGSGGSGIVIIRYLM